MKTVRYTILGGIFATTLIGAVGCGNIAISNQSSNAVTNQTSMTTQTSPKVQFFVPQQLPPNIMLRTIKSSPSQIELDYAPVGYDSMVANTFWIQEMPNGHLSSTSKNPIQLNSNIEGYYDTTPGKQAVSQQRLTFIIPSSLTSKAPMLVSVQSFNGSTVFGKSQMINIANNVITNVTMTEGISR